MLFSVIVTVLVAAIVIGAFCVKAVRLDKCRRRTKSYLLIPCSIGEKELEMLVKSCYWEEVFAGRDCARDVILLTSGNDEISEKAKSLEQEYSIVHCVAIDELAGFLELE